MPPCKVGDTVWAASGKIIKCEIDEMCLCDGGGIEYLVTFGCDGANCKGCPFNRWDKIVPVSATVNANTAVAHSRIVTSVKPFS